MKSMKHVHFLSLVCIALTLALSSCIKEVDLTTTANETTIIYGLLDVKDSKHYIRIQKAFLDKDKSALEMAKETDSIYYGDNLKVTLTSLTNGTIYNAKRVFGDTIGISKDSGVFVNAPNILYSIDGTLNKDHTYKITVENTLSGNIASSQVKLAHPPKVQFPFSGLAISMVDTTPYTVRWITQPNDKIFDLSIRFNYSERNTLTGITSYKSFEYIALKGVSTNSLAGNENIEQRINRTEFYRRLALALPVDANLVRTADPTNTIEFILSAGGDELDKYIQVKNAQGGISSISYLPTYTNITNGLGLFSSRTSTTVNNIILNPVSKDSLINGSFTKNLGFVP